MAIDAIADAAAPVSLRAASDGRRMLLSTNALPIRAMKQAVVSAGAHPDGPAFAPAS